MQPLRIERVAAHDEVTTNGHANGHSNGNGHTNGNGKGRKKATVVVSEEDVLPEIIEVASK